MASNTIHYTPPAIAKKFMQSNALVRGLMGPMGSGKSTTCCMELVRRACMQEKGPDGIRRTRWLVVRNTYPELRDTTIRTFQEWFSPFVIPGNYTTTAPPKQILQFDDVNMEVIFAALDTPEDTRKLLSLDITGAWLNEARELPKEVIQYLIGRIGRFPSKKDGGASWRGIIMDTNPPDDSHWWYKSFEVDPSPDFKIFKQPSGLAKNAENRENLPDDYYEKLLSAMDNQTADVMVHGKYGFVRHGEPVYKNVWDDTLHVSSIPLEPLPIMMNKPVIIGLDFGLTPAAVFLQKTIQGQWLVLHEIIPETFVGAEQFIPMIQDVMKAYYHAKQKFDIVGDPAGNQRAQTDARTAFDVFRSHGLHTRPSPTQSTADRLMCVRQPLARTIDGKPGLLLSPTCKNIRKAMNGGYHYKISQSTGEIKESPEKNEYSHISDALQYGLAGGGEYHLIKKNKQSMPNLQNQQIKGKWDL